MLGGAAGLHAGGGKPRSPAPVPHTRGRTYNDAVREVQAYMVPILINYPEDMLRVRVAAMKDTSSQALADLQELGVLHVEEAGEFSPPEVAGIVSRKQLTRKAVYEINGMLDSLRGVREVELPPNPEPLDPDDVINRVNALKERLSSLLEKRESLRRNVGGLESSERYFNSLAEVIDVPLADLHYLGPYLFSRVIILPREGTEPFLNDAGDMILHRVIAHSGGEDVMYLLGRARDKDRIEKSAANLGGSPLPILYEGMSLREFNTKRDAIREGLAQELDALESEIQGIIEERLEKIVVYRDILEREYSRLDVLEMAATARYITLFEGWVPQGSIERVSSEFSRNGRQVFVDSRPPGPQETPPTKLKNPEGIRPFQVIVNLFAIPRYGDWDPTPSIAYFFAFFFGLMLNDVIYAVGLLLTVWLVLDKLVDDPQAEGTRLFRRVLIICGSVSLVMGILSGTLMGDFLDRYMGIPPKTLALAGFVEAMLSEPISFIVFSLVVGLVHLNIAHVLSLIRGVKTRNVGLVINKIGLFFVQIFGIPYIFHVMLNMDLVPLSAGAYTVFGYLLALGVLGVIAGSFIQMGGLGSIFWVFDLTGILGDVMSYSRLAGVGLASFYLASSFNLLSNWVSTGLGSAVPGILGAGLSFIIGVTLLVIFHVFNMLLSALAAFIHSLRLCFVEFLLKFYEGGGREYSPFHIPRQRTVLVGRKS